MSKFKVGDKVYSITDGFGEVKSVSSDDSTYPMAVSFGKNSNTPRRCLSVRIEL
jgi:hypothetical protein